MEEQVKQHHDKAISRSLERVAFYIQFLQEINVTNKAGGGDGVQCCRL